jgi:hypothetical protein
VDGREFTTPFEKWSGDDTGTGFGYLFYIVANQSSSLLKGRLISIDDIMGDEACRTLESSTA